MMLICKCLTRGAEAVSSPVMEIANRLPRDGNFVTSENHASAPLSSPWLDISSEVRNPRTLDLDQRTTLGILEALNDEDRTAPAAVRQILPVMAALVDAAA